ncbi:MAG: hypothetical protein CBC42_02810 [Betaproteobacteria bacterium TMED82]|nr:MAG: hypothetical protein CBC42_02810 [Betaproteobacteria bacterium TMED82]|tara:strand:+ start:7019 stop:8281 length:1263 start_codon:yes stop_codon:yes gene_type:complete
MIKVSKNEIYYGFTGLLFAFTALPLYLATPVIYEGVNGLTLTTIGIILMFVRLSDAITDPIFGQIIDGSSGSNKYIKWLIPSLFIMIGSLCLLLNPPRVFETYNAAVLWLTTLTLAVSIFSGIALLSYQSWAVSWSADPAVQSRLIALREFFILSGVITASMLVTLNMVKVLSLVSILLLSLVFFMLISLKKSNIKQILQPKSEKRSWRKILVSSNILLYFIFLVNALANAIPALLFIFFFRDILKLDNSQGGILLAIYFLFSAIGIPVWKIFISRYGTMPTWCVSIAFSVVFFSFTYFLSEGDFVGFLVICMLTGFLLGAELICPPSILSNLITNSNHRGEMEASYFSIWNLCNKLSLAIASGTVLPLLNVFGYSSVNEGSENGLFWLQFFYAGIPCIIKITSLILIILFIKNREDLLP